MWLTEIRHLRLIQSPPENAERSEDRKKTRSCPERNLALAFRLDLRALLFSFFSLLVMMLVLALALALVLVLVLVCKILVMENHFKILTPPE